METNKPNAIPEKSDRDNLESIKGIGPTVAGALNKMGVHRFRDLLQYTPLDLSKALRERADLRITPKRIKDEGWIAQARSHMSTAEEIAETVAPPPDPAGWCQHAGFSLFFDCTAADQDKFTWHTRIYHDETGEEIVIPGFETKDWVSWILNSAQLPAALHLPHDQSETVAAATTPAPTSADVPEEVTRTATEISLDILDVDIEEEKPASYGPQKRLKATHRFSVSGAQAERYALNRAAFRVEVYAVKLNASSPSLVAVDEGCLEPGVFEYVRRNSFPIPDVGQYTIHSILLLLPPFELIAQHAGPDISIVP